MHDGYFGSLPPPWIPQNHPGASAGDKAILRATQPQGTGQGRDGLNAPIAKTQGGGKAAVGRFCDGSVQEKNPCPSPLGLSSQQDGFVRSSGLALDGSVENPQERWL